MTTRTTFPLYSRDALNLLEQALELAQSRNQELNNATTAHLGVPVYPKTNIDKSSSNEEEEEENVKEDDSLSSSESSDLNEDENHNEMQERIVGEREEQPDVIRTAENPSTTNLQAVARKMTPLLPTSTTSKKKTQRESHYIAKQSVPQLSLELNKQQILQVPAALVPKTIRTNALESCTVLKQMSQGLAHQHQQEGLVAVLLLKSGRFAGGIFHQAKCIAHKTLQHYTTRRQQGGAQSTFGKAKSMGAQLRRAGEEHLKQEVLELVGVEWKPMLNPSSSVVLVSCPPTMRNHLVGLSSGDYIKIPLDVGRPTLDSVEAVYKVMMQVQVVERNMETTTAPILDAEIESLEREMEQLNTTTIIQEEPPPSQAQPAETQAPALTPLHEAAANGDLESLKEILDEESTATTTSNNVNAAAGPLFMTPLHYASASAGDNAASSSSCVMHLLMKAGANPCLVDIRGRVPYFLAQAVEVRNAFRRARAQLGEDAWDWDKAKVGPPLTQEDEMLKNQKAADKKRRQRARQKEKRQKERAIAAEADARRKQEEEAAKVAAQQPKNPCDYCQKSCPNRKKMYFRLDYAYCSSECVLKHKRELMAAAAMARMGG